MARRCVSTKADFRLFSILYRVYSTTISLLRFPKLRSTLAARLRHSSYPTASERSLDVKMPFNFCSSTRYRLAERLANGPLVPVADAVIERMMRSVAVSAVSPGCR
jgi:hypothetical protein